MGVGGDERPAQRRDSVGGAQHAADDQRPSARARPRHSACQGVTKPCSWCVRFTTSARQHREHEAIDILAPRNTPVVAVEDGTIAKLFLSKAGGNTIYQFDPAGRVCYYYAHLERYADGLPGGGPGARGQVIGYVGTSGNAPKKTPHLHFAVFRLTPEKHWWEGTPIDPYDVLR